jgi:hypothetical protein
MNPALIAGGGAVAGGLIDSITRKKRGGVDTAPLTNIVNSSGDEQRSIIGSLKPKLQPLTDQYQSNVNGAVDKAQEDRASTNNAFLSSLRDKRSQMADEDMNQAKTHILQGVQPAQDAIREQLSGSGVGLQGGAAFKALSQPVLDANKQIGDYANNLDLTNRQAEISAMDKVNTGDNSFIAQKLGIDKDTYDTVMNSGRQDLINEMNGYLQEAQQREADKLGIAQFGMTGNMAADSANRADRAAFDSSLMGVGGGLLGYGATASKPQPNNNALLQALLAKMQ